MQSIAFLGGSWQEISVWCSAPWQDDEGDDGVDDDGGDDDGGDDGDRR